MAVEFSKVPEEIKNQFGSEQTTAVLTTISDGLYITNRRAVPHLLFLLETKGMPAHDFIQSIIRDAKITEEEAKSVAKEIKEKILEPMRYSLFQWGVDISDIKVNDAKNLDLEVKTSEAEKIGENISIEDLGSEKNEESVPIMTVVSPEEPKKMESDKPFILHEEKKTETAAGEKTSVLKSISIPLGFFRSKNQISTQPAKIEIETPNKNEKRVVNYSELRTSLSPFEDEQSFLSKKEVLVPSKTVPVKVPEPITPAPAPVIPLSPKKVNIFGTIKKPQPKVEGNTIDLKNG